MSEKRPIDIGIGVLLNEEEDVRGWAKTMLHFCNKVYALLDPKTEDNTYKILRYEFPNIEIIFQNWALGDSNNYIKGPKEILVNHKMLEWAINHLVKKGEFFMLLAADERFDPVEFPGIEYEIHLMKVDGYNGINFAKHMITYAPRDPVHYINFYSRFSKDSLFQCRFQRKVKDWVLDGKSGRSMNYNLPLIDSKFRFYHYCWLKRTREPYSYWRDRKEFADLPLSFHRNPLKEWRDMPMLDNNGDVIRDKIRNPNFSDFDRRMEAFEKRMKKLEDSTKNLHKLPNNERRYC
ncbi:MAG: hypothetical protein ACTSQ8_08045 [Candidatus Helarchaeota archaeon]